MIWTCLWLASIIIQAIAIALQIGALRRYRRVDAIVDRLIDRDISEQNELAARRFEQRLISFPIGGPSLKVRS